MKIAIINRSNNPLPKYATPQSAGLDIYADLKEEVTLSPLDRKLIPTGLYIALPKGYEAQIRPRSGLALKQGITVLNSPGTIDSDYRGEIQVLLINLSNSSVAIKSGDRIAQMIIAKHEQIDWELVSSLEDTTERGKGGFGHTGTK